MRDRFPLLFLVSLLGAMTAQAQTNPYSYEAKEFALPEKGLFDTFDDGSIAPDAQWFSLRGNITESGGAAILSSPGETGFLAPFPVDNAATSLSTTGFQINGGGSFTATATWNGESPDRGTGYSLAIGSLDGAGDVQQFSIGLSNTTTGVSGILGVQEGLSINTIRASRAGAPDGPLTSFVTESIVFDAEDISGDVILMLAFDDTLDQIVASASLDGGATSQSFAAIDWAFFGGSVSLSASSTVPEPGTALLVGFGLLALARWRR